MNSKRPMHPPARRIKLVQTVKGTYRDLSFGQRGLKFVGDGHDTEGSRWLIERVDAGSNERPLNIPVSGRTDRFCTSFMVSMERLWCRGTGDIDRRVSLYEINDQDHIAAWIRSEFPGMFYILGRAIRAWRRGLVV